jgi:hypothetical protein
MSVTRNQTEAYGPDKGGSKADAGKSAYPWPGGVVDLTDKHGAEMYLAKFNRSMADVENAMLHDRMLPGMAGYGDIASGQKGYSVPSPGPDKAKGMTIELQNK